VSAGWLVPAVGTPAVGGRPARQPPAAEHAI